MIRSFFFLLFLSCLLSGCGRIPEPAGYQFSRQQKMQAGYHWEILAEDTAKEINRELILNDFINTPVFVRATCGNENRPCEQGETSVFNESFRDLLITKLVGLGVPTCSVASDEAITVHYKAQTVYHHVNRTRSPKSFLLTALTAGVVVLRNAPAELVSLAAAGAIDTVNSSLVTSGHFEVLITTSLISEHRYIYRNSNIYYINDADSWHYSPPAAPAVIQLTDGTVQEKELKEPKETDKTVTGLPRPIIPEKIIEKKIRI